jgi:hypothetical protein
MGPVPLASLGTVAREWGRIGVLGFGGPPAHVVVQAGIKLIDPRRGLPYVVAGALGALSYGGGT